MRTNIIFFVTIVTVIGSLAGCSMQVSSGVTSVPQHPAEPSVIAVEEGFVQGKDDDSRLSYKRIRDNETGMTILCFEHAVGEHTLSCVKW